MANVSATTAMELVYAAIAQEFEPVVRKRVDEIVRLAHNEAKVKIAQDIDRMARDLAVRMSVFANHFKSRGITVDIVVHMPGIIDGQDAKAS